MPRFASPIVRLAAAALLALMLPATVVAQHAGSAFATTIEDAHGAERYHRHAALEADLTVNFGGSTIIDGSMLMRTDTSGVRIVQKAGPVAVFDGQRAWVTPDATAFPRARFHLLTWPYFLAAPAKLQDPGTQLEPTGKHTLHDVAHPTAKLTFSAGIGDSPDDWYVLYRNPENDQLRAMAYIVTYGKSTSETAKAVPHVIVYDDYQTVDGVTLSTRWTFYDWNEKDGAVGDPIGDVTLANLRFVEPSADAFRQPASAVEDALPDAGR
ncbi:MAG: hypothetical protein AAF772_15190 [Acidobacteriota bacterium]